MNYPTFGENIDHIDLDTFIELTWSMQNKKQYEIQVTYINIHNYQLCETFNADDPPNSQSETPRHLRPLPPGGEGFHFYFSQLGEDGEELIIVTVSSMAPNKLLFESFMMNLRSMASATTKKSGNMWRAYGFHNVKEVSVRCSHFHKCR